MNQKQKSDERRVITTAVVSAQEVADLPPRPGGGSVRTGGTGMSDDEYIARYASSEQKSGLRRLIEEERSKRPMFTFWRCSNPRCRWEGKLAGDMEGPLPCFRCNFRQVKEESGGGWLKIMTPAQVAAFAKKSAKLDQEAIMRLKRARFAKANEARGERGSAPLSWEQFLAERSGG